MQRESTLPIDNEETEKLDGSDGYRYDLAVVDLPNF